MIYFPSGIALVVGLQVSEDIQFGMRGTDSSQCSRLAQAYCMSYFKAMIP
jgi:hypothetical protein